MALEVFPSEPNLKLNEKCNIDKCNLKKVHAWKTPLAQEDCTDDESDKQGSESSSWKPNNNNARSYYILQRSL